MSQYIAKVEPNWLDKAITVINPAAGAKRMQSRTMLALAGSYTGARYDRRATQSWQTRQGSADADTLDDLWTLRNRSRDLVRNAPIALGAVNTVVQNAVGTGLAVQPTPDLNILGWDEAKGTAWASGVEHEFGLWADTSDCDVTRTQNFYEMQGLVMRSSLESGDVFTLLPMRQVGKSPYKTAIQIIEGDRVMSPFGHIDGMPIINVSNGNQVWAGVEVDFYGAPVAYYVYHKHPGSPDFMAGYKDNTLYDRVPAFGTLTGRKNVLHIFDRRRPDQKRGIPYLAPIIEMIKQLDRYTEAEIMAAVVTAMFTVFVKTENGDGLPQVTNNVIKPGEVSLAPGAVIGLAPGESIETADTLRPNAGFDPFVTSILRQIGVALELPFEILIKHFTASYSAARAAMLEAWKFYKNRRDFLATRFCQPAYEAWMDEAVANGRVTAPGYFSDPLMRRAYLSSIWIGDAPGQIDPQKEVDAAEARVQGGFSTRKREAMELTGTNFTDNHNQLALEHKVRVEAGLEPEILNVTSSTELVGAPGASVPDPNAPGSGGSDLEQPDVTPAKPAVPPVPNKKRGRG